jgi:hypothetical protein
MGRTIAIIASVPRVTPEQEAAMLKTIFRAACGRCPDPEAVAFLRDWRAPTEGTQAH